jgi:hypothetical protein
MGGVEILVVFAVVMGIAFALRWVVNANNSEYDTETDSTENPSPAVTPVPSRSTHASRPPDYEALFVLPGIYYVLAILCGVVLLIVTLVNAKDLSGAEIGSLIGYSVGAVLSMFAVGRVIELLQQIRDAVRNIPALSPSRPDDE